MIYKDILLKKLDDLAVLELKEGSFIEIGDKKIEGYLPLPLLNKNLVSIVKENIEDLPIEYFVEGIIYTISLNKDTPYKTTYMNFLWEVSKDLKSYVFSRGLEEINKENYLEGIVYLNFLVNEDMADEKTFFSLGQGLENLDISILNEKEKNQYALEIMNIYEKVLNLDRNFSLAHYKLGHIYKEFGQFIKAKLSFEKFMELDKNEFRIQEAREEIENIESELLKEKAVLDLNSGLYDKALDKLLKVDIDKKDDLYFYHLSLSYYNLKDIDGALDAILRAIEIEDVAIYHNQLAIIYQVLGDMDLAKKEIEETIDKFGPDYYLNFNLGTIQYNEDNFEAALGNFEIAYDLNPNPEILEIINQISRQIGN